jgi:hypothetical protein
LLDPFTQRLEGVAVMTNKLSRDSRITTLDGERKRAMSDCGVAEELAPTAELVP